jgi:ribonucleotide monophosphatase NagD (HAD superfamily)
MQGPAVRALLIDISGTLHVGAKPTPDAGSALRRLQASGIPYRFYSNTSK